MALVLLCTVPSGLDEVVHLRGGLSSRLRLPLTRASRALRPAVVHSDRPVGQDAARLIYVGCGRNDPQQRPSVFFSPFFFCARAMRRPTTFMGSGSLCGWTWISSCALS